MRLVESDSLTNQNIATALEVGSYTADATREIYAMIWATQVAGNGDYTAYLTVDRAGAGTTYRVVPITTAAAASGVTSICLTTVAIPVRSGDVVKAFLTGLAGDTTTPDTVVDWFEADYLRPTTADRTLDVTATGAAGLDWGNVENPTTAVNLSATNIKTDQVVGSVTGAVGSVAGNVGGNVVGSVGSVAAGGITAAALATDAVTELTAAIAALSLETGLTWQQGLQLIAAAAAGKLSGAATATNTIRNAVADDKNRITATVDADGNRTAVTYDLT